MPPSGQEGLHLPVKNHRYDETVGVPRRRRPQLGLIDPTQVTDSITRSGRPSHNTPDTPWATNRCVSSSFPAYQLYPQRQVLTSATALFSFILKIGLPNIPGPCSTLYSCFLFSLFPLHRFLPVPYRKSTTHTLNRHSNSPARPPSEHHVDAPCWPCGQPWT